MKKLILVMVMVLIVVMAVTAAIKIHLARQPVLTDIAVDNSGNIFALDEKHDRILILDPDGHCIVKTETEHQITAITVDSTRLLLWAVSKKGEILKFLSNGELVGLIETYLPANRDEVVKHGGSPYSTLSAALIKPVHIEVDSDGNILILDRGDMSIKGFNREGKLLLNLRDNFTDLDIDPQGNIWTAKFSSPGSICRYTKTGESSAEDDHLNGDRVEWPLCLVALDAEKYCMIHYIRFGRYQSGPYLTCRKLGEAKPEWHFMAWDFPVPYVNTAEKELSAICKDSQGNIYAAGGNLIYKISSSGKSYAPLSKWKL